ncbi:spinster family MFS transporter [Brevundimonas pishanensis]|uniref:spinster family MFS transporter n=1 Tax=Brevundimonas pishanensis TaxID=2896315 RepID=UPI001FA716AE|nr:MFS transporter [Brevundimonas pishanensis]
MKQTATATSDRVGWYPYVVVLMLGLVYTFNYLDRQILAILAEPIKADLGLTDTQIGMVSGLMFAVFYTVFGVPIAWLADRSHRVGIVAVACTMWSVFCGLCGMAQNYTHLVLARIGVGIGEAGGASPSMSVISDYFPPHRRGGAIGLFSLGVPLGATIGVAFGAWVAAHYGWRQAFIAVAVPGVVLSLLLILFVREPKRGRFDPPLEAKAKPASLMECLRTYRRTPTLSLLLLAAGTYSFVFNAFAAWAPALLLRAKGAEMADISTWYSLVFGIAMAIGMFGSGFLADRFAQRKPSAYAILPAWALGLGVPFFIAGLLAPSWPVALGLLAVPMAMNMMFVAPGFAICQNVAPANQRATISAILMLVNNLVGMGFGPLFVGALSQHFSGSMESGAALTKAMLFVAPFYLPAIGALILVARALEKRHAAMEAQA